MTSTPESLRFRCVTLISCLLLAPWLTACGGGQTPAEAVPALQSGLDAVDAAIDSGDDAAARRSLETLADQTVRARAAGTISDDQGDRILRAISDLEGQLSAATATPSPSPAPEPTDPTSGPGSAPIEEPEAPETSGSEETEDSQDDDSRDPDDEGKGKEREKKKDKDD